MTGDALTDSTASEYLDGDANESSFTSDSKACASPLIPTPDVRRLRIC